MKQSAIQYNEYIASQHRHTSPAQSRTSAQWSSPLPSRRRKPRKESTKSWALRTFYSTPATAPTNNTSSPPPSRKPDQPKSPERKGKKKKVETIPPDCKEEPSIRFSNLNIEEGAEVFKFSLVGKFPRMRPSLDLIRDWAREEWKLKGGWSITLLDQSHVFIRLDNEEDMIKVWQRSRWFVGENPMKVFKWFPTFRGDAEGEPSTAAVWISLPMLPVVLFQEKFLYQVAGLVGKVVTMDRATRNLSRTNVARVCVEADLAKKLPNRLKIEIEDFGFWQDVVYEKLPYYCTHCSKQGHSTNICKFSKLHDEKIDDGEQEKTDSMNDVENQTLPNVAVDLQAQTCPEILNKSASKLFDEKINDGEQKKSDSMNDVENQTLPNAAVDLHAQTCPDILNRSGRKKRVTITEAVNYHTGSMEKKRKGKSVEGVEKSFVQRYIYDGRSKGSESGIQGLQFRDEVIGTSVVGIMMGLQSATFLSRKRAMLEKVENEGDQSPRVQTQALKSNDHLSVNGTKLKPTAARKKLRLRSALFFWKRKENAFDSISSSPNRYNCADLTTRRFTLAEIKHATKNFASSLIIGRGGYGFVFRGTIDGIEVAVKSNSTFSEQGCREFEAEVLYLSKLSHKNLVKLIGYCINSIRRILVYEFIPRGNLKELSYGNASNLLSWTQRLKTCLGVARGLRYLHENGIVHRDVKTNNVLIDEDYEAKISDMGLSMQQSTSKTFTYTAIAGTAGYLDPEYFAGGRVSTKSDVYSFGVVLFEVLCGRPPIKYHTDEEDKRFLLEWAQSKTKNGNLEDIVDRRLNGYVKKHCLIEYVGLATNCVSERASDRPTMEKVVNKLELVLELEEGGDPPSSSTESTIHP